MGEIQRLKSKIKYQDVYSLLDEYGAEPRDLGDHIESLTVCHGGDSHKLYYYKDTGQFMCYTHDGSFDVIGLISKVENISFGKAINRLKKIFGISDFIEGEFVSNDKNLDNYEELNPVKKIKTISYEDVKFKSFDDTILKTFYDIPHMSWINEGIDVNSIKKFEIKYDLTKNRIIIPHRDIYGDLVGIRARNLNEEIVEEYGKYTPIYYKNVDYRYKTGDNLYGIYQNKENIVRSKQIILFEAEKSVVMMDGMYSNSNAVALNGTMLTNSQIALINSLGVNEVVVALDKEFDEVNDKDSIKYAKKISSIFGKLKNRYSVSIVWDQSGFINRKDAPCDKGRVIFEKMLRERIYL